MIEPKKIEPAVFKFQSIYDEPKWEIKRGRQWIEFGADNKCFDYIDGLLEMSPDHAAILNGLTQYVVGEGLSKPTESRAVAFFTNGETSAAAPNNLNEIMKKVARDLVVYGGALINIRWTRDGSAIADLNYVEAKKMLPDVESGYWISNNWQQHKKEGNIPEFFPVFSDAEGERKGSQLIYLRLPNARKTPLALPAYWSGREYIEADQELITMSLNRTRNGFFPSIIINYKNTPSQEEQDINHESLKKFFAGSMNAGKAAEVYGDNVEFQKFESGDVPKDFELLQKTVDRKIRSAHRVAGRGDLFGLNTGEGTTFSSNDDLINEFEVYSRTVVRPYQMLICDTLNMLAAVNGINHTWEIEPFELFPSDNTNSTEEGEATGAPVEDVQSQAMNGAQVDSFTNVIPAGKMSKTTAAAFIRAAFPSVTEDLIQAMLSGITEIKSTSIDPNPDIIP